MYWAQALASQNKQGDLKTQFTAIAEKMAANEEVIVSELNTVQGQKAPIGGYYEPTDNLADAIMKPSSTLNAILASI